MNVLPFALVLAGVLLNALAQLCLKSSAIAVGRFAFTAPELVAAAARFAGNGAFLTGLGCYAVSVVLWVMALSRLELGIAYPMLSIGYVLNAIFARVLFGEALSPERAIGIAVIVVGVWILARS